MTDEEKKLVYHAEMMIGNQRFMFSDSRDKVAKGQNMSIVINFDSAEEVEREKFLFLYSDTGAVVEFHL
ncbi:MAG: hypothetical protein GX213_14340 [Clostridiaceae bacterium]|nr:hypothetical protein [Clostridiaceae bacterium]